MLNSSNDQPTLKNTYIGWLVGFIWLLRKNMYASRDSVIHSYYSCQCPRIFAFGIFYFILGVFFYTSFIITKAKMHSQESALLNFIIISWYLFHNICIISCYQQMISHFLYFPSQCPWQGEGSTVYVDAQVPPWDYVWCRSVQWPHNWFWTGKVFPLSRSSIMGNVYRARR